MTQHLENKGGRLQVYNVPLEWMEILLRESRRRGISVSDFVKVYILEPWVRKHEERRNDTLSDIQAN